MARSEFGSGRDRETAAGVVLAVHDDQRVLAMVTRALSTFRPGFRVASAMDVATALGWLEALDVDLIIAGSAVTDPALLSELLASANLDSSRLVVLRAPGEGDEHVARGPGVVLEEPVNLSTLLRAVWGTISTSPMGAIR
jgi:PleD family two-component response regulator